MLQTQTETRTDVLLDVEGLRTYFFLRGGILKAVDGVSFQLKPHETLTLRLTIPHVHKERSSRWWEW